jgi:hypothetical protein
MNKRFFLFIIVSVPVLGPTQSPVQWVSLGHLLGIKRRGREANQLPLAQERLDLYHHAPVCLNGFLPY